MRNKKQYISPASHSVSIGTQPIALSIDIDQNTEVDASESWTRRDNAWSADLWSETADE